MFITSFLHENKKNWVIRGEFQSDFCENLTEFYQISLKILVNLTDFSPQVKACMCNAILVQMVSRQDRDYEYIQVTWGN